MIRVISGFADGPVNFNPTGPAEDQTQKLILSTVIYMDTIVRALAIARSVHEGRGLRFPCNDLPLG